MNGIKIHFYEHDLSAEQIANVQSVAIDTETTGLSLLRDRLCLVQLCFGEAQCYLIRVIPGMKYPNLCKLLANKKVLKLYHYGRFDIAMLYKHFGVLTTNVFCTKLASKFARTYTERHGLPNLCRELLGVELSKDQQSSDWGSIDLTEGQKHYAASDVLYLHGLKDILEEKLIREKRFQIFSKACEFLPYRAQMDAMGFDQDLFAWA